MEKELISNCCEAPVERLPNVPELGDGYAHWRRYKCTKCGKILGFEETKRITPKS